MKEIPLTQGYVAVVDDEDHDKISKHKWCALRIKLKIYAVRNGYVNGKRRLILMHQAILDLTGKNTMVDHINNDGLDNRRENLRECTSSQNNCNRLPLQTKSIYKGIYWDKSKKWWKVEIVKDHKKHYVGIYKSEVDAALAYNKAALKWHGDFARLNIL